MEGLKLWPMLRIRSKELVWRVYITTGLASRFRRHAEQREDFIGNVGEGLVIHRSQEILY